MTARRSELVTAAAGVTAVVLLVAELATWGNPHATDSLASITGYFVSNRNTALASLELGLAGAVMLLVFAAGLSDILRREAGASDMLPTIALAGGVLCLSTEITFVTTTGALTFVAGHASESEIRLLVELEGWIDQFRFLSAGILIGAASLAMIGGSTFRWIRWLGIASGALLLVSQTSPAWTPSDPLGGVSNVGVLGLLLGLIWLLGVSVNLIRRPAALPALAQRPQASGSRP